MERFITNKHVFGSSCIPYLRSCGWLLGMLVDSRHDSFMFVCLLSCLFILTLAAVFLIHCGYMIAITLSSLMERNLLRFFLLLRSCHFNNFWVIQNLIIQKVSLNARGNS